jgi:hypothetical protein
MKCRIKEHYATDDEDDVENTSEKYIQGGLIVKHRHQYLDSDSTNVCPHPNTQRLLKRNTHMRQLRSQTVEYLFLTLSHLSDKTPIDLMCYSTHNPQENHMENQNLSGNSSSAELLSNQVSSVIQFYS